LEFCFAIDLRARLFRKALQEDLARLVLRYNAPPQKEQRLTRGVFPTAPVKPFTECDVKFLERADLNTAALEGIMVVGEMVAK
jgi:hypothetical protein